MAKINFNQDRRGFFKLLGLAGGGLILAGAGGRLLFNTNSELGQIRQTRNMMGTFVQLTAFEQSRDKAEAAFAEAYSQISRLEGILSRFDADSAVHELNQSGKLHNAPPELLEVLKASAAVRQASHGVFDPTILPLLAVLESQVKANGRVDAHDLAQAAELVNMDALTVKGSNIAFARSGMALTLDGIAKGYIVDQAIESLRQAGIKHALVNAGGDIRALGGKPDGSGWDIAVQDPKDPDNLLARFSLKEGAVATSGNYQAYYDKAKLYCHLANPQSAEQPLQAASVTITAPGCLEADAYASAVFASGPKAGLHMLASRDRMGALLVDRSGRQESLRFTV